MIKWKVVKLLHIYTPENVLPEDELYRYLYQPWEAHGNQRQSATDLRWSKDAFGFEKIIQELGNCGLYYLKDGPQRAFFCEELMLISENTELTLEYVKDW